MSDNKYQGVTVEVDSNGNLVTGAGAKIYQFLPAKLDFGGQIPWAGEWAKRLTNDQVWAQELEKWIASYVPLGDLQGTGTGLRAEDFGSEYRGGDSNNYPQITYHGLRLYACTLDEGSEGDSRVPYLWDFVSAVIVANKLYAIGSDGNQIPIEEGPEPQYQKVHGGP